MTPTQQKVHKLLQLAMECETYHVFVSYSAHTDGVSVQVLKRPYVTMAEPIYSETAYIDGDLEYSQEFGASKLDRMIAYVEGLS